MIIIGCFTLTSFLVGVGTSGEIDSLFPQMEGWTQKGNPVTYTPDNLYEYIDGAADVFLSYDFVKLATVSLENEKKASITIDIYRHSSPVNGFGIYSQEKSKIGPFLSIGTQGYYEKGILNFLKGSFYVKISGYDLGDQDETILTETAKLIAQKIDDDNHFPEVVACFPREEKVENSERYVAQNFLGHSFLHSAFVADYNKDGRKFEVFIIQADDENGSGKILDSYLNFIKGKGMEVENPGDNLYHFQDPYYRSSGKMHMKRNGKYIWGLFCQSSETAGLFINRINENLAKLKLISIDK
jgi:hypothetical protein